MPSLCTLNKVQNTFIQIKDLLNVTKPTHKSLTMLQLITLIKSTTIFELINIIDKITKFPSNFTGRGDRLCMFLARVPIPPRDSLHQRGEIMANYLYMDFSSDPNILYPRSLLREGVSTVAPDQRAQGGGRGKPQEHCDTPSKQPHP